MAKELALIGCGKHGQRDREGHRGGRCGGSSRRRTSWCPMWRSLAAASGRRSGPAQAPATTFEAVRGAKIVLIAVKPQYLDDVVRGFAPAVVDDALVVSIAAGVTIARLEGLLGEGRKIVRVMPNLPAMVLAGMSSLTPNAQVSADEIAHVKELFESFGRAEIVPEPLLMR